jgi:hypothetical protein
MPVGKLLNPTTAELLVSTDKSEAILPILLALGLFGVCKWNVYN